MINNKIPLALIVLLIISLPLFSQFSLPITQKDFADYERERKIRSFIGIDLSVTKANEIKNNELTDNSIVVSRIYYQETGVPKKIIHYDSLGRFESFSKIQYYENFLPKEKKRFSKDSVLLDGVIYEYNQDNLISSLINFRSPALLLTRTEYLYKQNKVVESHYNSENSLLYKHEMQYFEESEKSNLKSSIKSDADNHVFETIKYSYDKNGRLHEKNTISDFKGKTTKNYFYNIEGAITETIEKDLINNEVLHTVFQYDDFGNLIKIIEYDGEENIQSYLTVEYFVKSSGSAP